MVVGKHLELGVQIEVQVDETAKCSSGMTGWEGLEAIVDLVLVAGANIRSVHDLQEAITLAIADHRDIGLADSQEVRAQSSDKPFQEDLEDGGANQGVQQPKDGVVQIPEAANANLTDEEDQDRDEGGHNGGSPDWHYLMAHRIGKLRVDDLAIAESHGERSRWRRVCVVNLKFI